MNARRIQIEGKPKLLRVPRLDIDGLARFRLGNDISRARQGVGHRRKSVCHTGAIATILLRIAFVRRTGSRGIA